jgi:hypothetical protein
VRVIAPPTQSCKFSHMSAFLHAKRPAPPAAAMQGGSISPDVALPELPPDDESESGSDVDLDEAAPVAAAHRPILNAAPHAKSDR